MARRAKPVAIQAAIIGGVCAVIAAAVGLFDGCGSDVERTRADADKQRAEAEKIRAQTDLMKVIAASNKDDVYVVSISESLPVRVGDELVVSRDGKYVATIVVDKVDTERRVCTGHTKRGTSKLAIQIGDSVALLDER